MASNAFPSLSHHLRATVSLAVPLAVAQLATFMMGIVDVACVGRYSETALGALAIGNAVAWGCSCLLLGIPFALDPLISQCIGAGEDQRAYQWFQRGCQVVCLVAVPLIGIELILAAHIHVFGIDQKLADSVWSYLIFRAPALLFFQLFLTGRAYLQAHSVTRPILAAAIAANVVNLILDVLLVFGDRSLEAIGLPSIGLPPLGEAGAGLTTTFSTLCLCLYVHHHVRRHRPPKKPSRSNRIYKRTIIRLAWPISLQQVGESWLFCVFGILSGRFGAVAASGHQVALTLAAAAFMLALGISSATAVRVGHAVGDNDQGAIRSASLAGTLLVLVVMAVTAVTFILFPNQLVELLTDSMPVQTLAIPLLSFAAAFALFDGLQAVVAGALRGAGDVRVPFLLSVLAYWGVGGTVGWYAMHSPMEIQGIWIGLSAGLMVAAIALGARLAWLLKRPIRRVEGAT